MTEVLQPLPSITVQAQRLIELGAPALLGTTDAALLDMVQEHAAPAPDTPDTHGASNLLVPAASAINYTELLALVQHSNKPGFVVSDLTDIAEFVAIPEAPIPVGLGYVLHDLQRGDQFQNDSPAEALAALDADHRTPITMLEGILWLLHQPEALSRNNCFMTIASRKPKPRGGYDSRTPALWISNGTGRDGAENKNAPKLGWCWWNNRHTWLGIANAQGRTTIN